LVSILFGFTPNGFAALFQKCFSKSVSKHLVSILFGFTPNGFAALFTLVP
jgi:hypothetical protein